MISGKDIDFLECAQTGQKIAADTVISEENNVVRFVFKGFDRKKDEDD